MRRPLFARGQDFSDHAPIQLLFTIEFFRSGSHRSRDFSCELSPQASKGSISLIPGLRTRHLSVLPEGFPRLRFRICIRQTSRGIFGNIGIGFAIASCEGAIFRWWFHLSRLRLQRCLTTFRLLHFRRSAVSIHRFAEPPEIG